MDVKQEHFRTAKSEQTAGDGNEACTYVCMYMFKKREGSDEAGLEVMT